MNIVVINGSPRINGLTAYVLHSLERELVLQGNNVEFVDLIKLKMEHCRGCCSCYRTGRCFMNDDAEILSRKIGAADGLVLGSPTYASNVSGLMKEFIDRGHFVIEQLLRGKYCITVATGENYGNKSTRKILDDLVTLSGGILCDHIAVKAPFDERESVEGKIGMITKRAALRLNGKKKRIIRRFYHHIAFSIGIKPFVISKGECYKGVTKRWSDMGLRVY